MSDTEIAVLLGLATLPTLIVLLGTRGIQRGIRRRRYFRTLRVLFKIDVSPFIDALSRIRFPAEAAAASVAGIGHVLHKALEDQQRARATLQRLEDDGFLTLVNETQEPKPENRLRRCPDCGCADLCCTSDDRAPYDQMVCPDCDWDEIWWDGQPPYDSDTPTKWADQELRWREAHL